MLVVHIILIFTVAYTAGSSHRASHNKHEDLNEDAISNLQLLLPLKGNQHQKKLIKVGAPGHLGVISDGPYSQIPNNEFVLDDALTHLHRPNKTTKKDLSQLHDKYNKESPEENSVEFSTVQLNNRDSSSSENLHQKCQKYLQIEELRSQFEPVLKFPLVDKGSHSEDRKLLLSLCRVHLGLQDLTKEQKSVKEQSLFPSAGNLGVAGSGGVGDQSDFAVNVAVNGQSGVLGNMAFRGIGGHAGNVGIRGKGGAGKLGKGKGWGDKVAFKILTGQAGVAGNAGFNGLGGSAWNVGIEGTGGQSGHLGVSGQGGFFGNGIGSDPNQSDGEIVGQNLEQDSRSDNQLGHNNIQCHVGSLAYGGKREQVGDVVNGNALGNSHPPCCGHSHCMPVYLLVLGLNSNVARTGQVKSGGREATTPAPERQVKVVDVSKFRPLWGRRDWMTLDSKVDDRLRQYINNHKQWRTLKDSKELKF